jgi:hypothetical protein
MWAAVMLLTVSFQVTVLAAMDALIQAIVLPDGALIQATVLAEHAL